MSKQPGPKSKAFMCPNCGEVVPAKALACPECGADEHTGWSGNVIYNDLDLPDPGWGDEQEPARLRTWPRVIVVGVLVLLVIMLLLGWL